MSRRRILLLFLSFLVTLTGATYFVLHQTGAARSFVEQLIGKTIRQDLFRLDEAEIDLTAGTLIVRRFTLENPESSNEPLLSVDKVEVEVETNPLGEVGAIRKVALDGLAIHLSLADGKIPDLSQILRAAGVGETTATASVPSITVTNSTVHLRVAPQRPVITFRDLRLTLLPLQSDPDQLELRGTMVSPLGHTIEIQGGGNFKKQEFRSLLIAKDIPIKPEQAAAFRREAADFLDAAKVTGVIKKTTVWMELRPPSAAPTSRFHAGISAEFADVVAIPAEFPYAITGASGRVFATTEDEGTIKFQLQKKGVDGDLRANGKVTHCFLGTPLFDIHVDADDILIGDRLKKAIAGARLDLVEKIHTALKPTAGRLDAQIQLYNKEPGAKLSVAADVTLVGVSAAYHGFRDRRGRRIGFPYPLRNVGGTLEVRPDGVTVQNVRGVDTDGNLVTIHGRVDIVGRDARPNLDIRGKAIAFSPRIRSALAALLDDGGAIYDEYSPRGKTDLTVLLRDEGKGVDYTIELNPLLASAAYKTFPYRIDEVQGRVKIANAGVWIDLDGKRRGATVSVDGRFLNAPGDGQTGLRSELWVKFSDAAFDTDLHKAAGAFSPNITRFWNFVNPRGKLDCELTMWREFGETEFTYDVNLGVKASSIAVAEFPVPMENLEGNLFLHGKGNECRCDISPVRGTIANAKSEPPAKVLIQGTVRIDAKGLDSDVTSIIQRLRLTPELGAALGKGKIFDADTWRSLKLDGYVDITAHHRKKADQANFDQRFQVRLRDISSAAVVLPGRAHDLHGEIVVERGVGTFKRIEGKIDETKVLVHSGRVFRDGKNTVIDCTVNADSFPVDARLAKLMSGPVRQAFLDLEMKGRAKLDEVNMVFRFPDVGDATETRIEGDVEAHDLFMDIGIPGRHSLRHLTGLAHISGRIDATGGQLSGQLKNVGFELTNQQIYGINGRFKITPQRLTCHELKFTLAGGQVKSSRKDGLTVQYDFTERGRLSAFLIFHGVSLNGLLRARGLSHSKVRGILEGELAIQELIGNDFLSMRATGEVVVTNGRLGRVPMFAAIYSQMKPESRPQFTKGKVAFAIADQKIKLTHLNARSDVLDFKVVGRGELGMDGYMDVRFSVPGVFGSAADLFILPPLIDWAVSKMVSFRVYGYIRDPKVVWTGREPKKRSALSPIGPVSSRR